MSSRIDTNKRRVWIGGLGFALIGLIFFGTLEYYKKEEPESQSLSVDDPRRFNQAVWLAQQGSDADENPRKLMLEDLQKNHFKSGMPKAEIIQLLGTPDSPFQEDEEEPCLNYRIGKWVPAQEGEGVFRICLNASGGLDHFQIQQE